MNNFTMALIYVIARLKEPSTYAGLAGLLAAYHVPHSADIGPLLAQLLVAAFSIAAIFLSEKSK